MSVVRLSKPRCDIHGLAPSPEELQEIFAEKYTTAGANSGPQLRLRHGYFNPDDVYEAIVAKLIDKESRWADIGCGRNIFPFNKSLARRLSESAARVVGIDPDENIRENDYVDLKFEGRIEDFEADEKFDLITMRMVAEHIEDPCSTLRKLAEITALGGAVVVYTPNKWSPVELITRLVPFQYHNKIKNIFWKTDARDTFPTQFKMNTRSELSGLFTDHGFREVFFIFADDCRVGSRYSVLSNVEMYIRRWLFALNVRYPENCLIGIYERI